MTAICAGNEAHAAPSKHLHRTRPHLLPLPPLHLIPEEALHNPAPPGAASGLREALQHVAHKGNPILPVRPLGAGSGNRQDPHQTVAFGAIRRSEVGDGAGELLQRAEVGEAAAGAAVDVEEVDQHGQVDGFVERIIRGFAEGVVESGGFVGVEADVAGVGVEFAEHLEDGLAQALGEGEGTEAGGEVLDA